MPMKPEISENNRILIEKIKKQSKEIIDEIEKFPSITLDKIKDWINQIKPESLPSEDIQLLATIIVIDTIHFYFKNESNKKKKNLIENCLCNLINKLSHLPNDKILAIVSYLKAYIKTNDADAKSKLEEFIDKLTSSTNRLSLIRDKSKQIFASCKKSKSNFNNIFKTQLNNISIAELASEVGSECQFSFFEGSAYYSAQFTNSSPQSKGKIIRKKIKPRIIAFDEDGIGYDVNSLYLYLKEVKRLSAINMENDLTPRMILKEELDRLGKIDINEKGCLKELEKQIVKNEFKFFASEEEKQARSHENKEKMQARQRVIQESQERSKRVREFLKVKQKKTIKEKKISKLLDPFVFRIQEKIDKCKETSSNNDKYLLDLTLPFFGDIKDGFLNDFLATIKYDDEFKKLINFAENIFILINKTKETLKEMDEFSNSLGFPQSYVGRLNDSQKEMNEIFSKREIINFLEDSLVLFKQRTLNLDNKYCLFDEEDKKDKKDEKDEIEFSELKFLNSFISDNCPKRILKLNSEHLEQFFSQKYDTTLFDKYRLENKDNLLKLLFNLFSGKFYFSSKNHQDKFVKKYILNFKEHPNFKSIKDEIFKLKWWQFILIGISPFHVFKKRFKELLSKKLFLNLIEEEFNKIFNKIDELILSMEDQSKQKKSFTERLIKYMDNLYSIQNRLEVSNIGDNNQSIPLSLINASRSRQEIIDRLNNHEEMKELLEKVLNLANNTTGCVNKFSKLRKACQRESKKFFPSLDLPNKIIFKNDVTRGLCLPINNTGNFPSSYVSRSIN
jgi:hypothetical protein